jgi:ABC-type lipoprotein release transport system permease subunit
MVYLFPQQRLARDAHHQASSKAMQMWMECNKSYCNAMQIVYHMYIIVYYTPRVSEVP